MLVVNNKRYTKKHVIGGSGFLDTIFNFGKKLLTSNAAKQVASALAASAAKQAGKHIVDRILRPASQAIPLQPIVDDRLIKHHLTNHSQFIKHHQFIINNNQHHLQRQCRQDYRKKREMI